MRESTLRAEAPQIAGLVMESIREWQSDQSEGGTLPLSLGVFLKVQWDTVASKVVYPALGIDGEGYREVLGFWTSGSDAKSALSWRGLAEPLLVVGDGLQDLREAVKEVYPEA